MVLAYLHVDCWFPCRLGAVEIPLSPVKGNPTLQFPTKPEVCKKVQERISAITMMLSLPCSCTGGDEAQGVQRLDIRTNLLCSLLSIARLLTLGARQLGNK